jgi:hypothetical protein
MTAQYENLARSAFHEHTMSFDPIGPSRSFIMVLSAPFTPPSDSAPARISPRAGEGGPGRGRYGLGSLTTASNTRDLQHGLNVYWAALSQSSQIRCFVSGRAYSLPPFLLFCDEIDFFASASL